MKKLLACCLALASITASTAQTNSAHFLSQPSLTPDGETVVFSFEGDIWKARISDGQAVRLTAMQGYETNAKVSPDGKWIAFTGRQYGNGDVYIVPISGGEIKQLTYFSGTDDVNSWSWDSKSIYFTSPRLSRLASYTVSINGGTAKPVFGDHYFQFDHNVFEHPKSGEIFFNDTWESLSQLFRKRYKGPFNPDIQSYNRNSKKYKRYTDWEGKDFGTTIDREGNVYFLSDEANGEYNLYTLQNEKKVPLTSFKTSLRGASVNANGGKIVFEKEYQLWMYDVATKKSQKLDISIVRNNVLMQEKDFDIRGRISDFDVSPDGKKLAFISRGEIFVSDMDGKFVQQVNRGSAERASEVRWLADNRTLLFNQTLNGFQNLYTIAADGKGGIKGVTNDKANNRSIYFNKKKTKAVYLSGRNEVRILDLKTVASTTIVKDEIWGFGGSEPSFSPDDQFVAFTAFRNFEQDILVYDTKTNRTINLTNTGVSEMSPTWSPDGKYLYFSSSRLKPSYPTGPQNPHLYRLPLQNLDTAFYSDKYMELFDTTKKKAPENVTVKIDPNQIMDRIELVGPSFGSQYLVGVVQKDDKTNVLYITDQVEGRWGLYRTELRPFDGQRTEKINGGESGSASLVQSGDKYYVLLRGAINKLNIDANKLEPINFGHTFRRNLAGEFRQMFYEGWAQIEQNFYDENFHGIDWTKTRDYYAQFLPYLNNRNDLRVLMNDMLGELNSSHQGFSSAGDDEAVALKNVTLETGILFDTDDPYKVKSVVKRSNADKLNVDVKPGDVLVKVDEVEVSPTMDRYYYFSRPSLNKEFKLTFKRGGQLVDVKLHPQTSINNQLYDTWINQNLKKVKEKTNNKIAYVHMKDMQQEELEKFIVEMTKQMVGAEGLILDLRYNTGGNVHNDVLQFLSQRSYLQWKYREGALTPQPNFAPSDKPIVLLINEQSLSDAEMTAQGFKTLKLGNIIGTETYRWIIFTNGATLVDGSAVRLPSWGCYALDGTNLEMNGVKPDLRVINTFEDKLMGRDPQLDAAIEDVLKRGKK